jgi:hypothetical protein
MHISVMLCLTFLDDYSNDRQSREHDEQKGFREFSSRGHVPHQETAEPTISPKQKLINMCPECQQFEPAAHNNATSGHNSFRSPK